jgi:hypothetical protein
MNLIPIVDALGGWLAKSDKPVLDFAVVNIQMKVLQQHSYCFTYNKD